MGGVRQGWAQVHISLDPVAVPGSTEEQASSRRGCCSSASLGPLSPTRAPVFWGRALGRQKIEFMIFFSCFFKRENVASGSLLPSDWACGVTGLRRDRTDRNQRSAGGEEPGHSGAGRGRWPWALSRCVWGEDRGDTSPAQCAVPERPREGFRPWGSQEPRKGISLQTRWGDMDGFGVEDLVCAISWRWSLPPLMGQMTPEPDHAPLRKTSMSWGCL